MEIYRSKLVSNITILCKSIEIIEFDTWINKNHQNKLLDYFEQTYFATHRIKQWATWYRQSMYDCEWIADTNIHVESWHNYLKTHILQRKTNVRVDNLMRVLRQAENIYYWKWSRVRAGWVTNANPGWIKMLGLPENVVILNPVDDLGNQNNAPTTHGY